ncbi:hypothetical protein S7711_00499 [Stachybotrys chartarum IBT 7711]|uniref:Cell surface protein n=1 Tax=Stachybotrys chartarum (strain CBS 109288 / IBT 7711) TaxID=1280523 RepID=A0A084B9W3_STACB|nr:hypothetical protein S7711_00499 [Stachybotrys chartarum IBT 7711]KFA53395.1 hypothetical protein S40293_03424 [Stachybotrys chartarum IBT 40293]KFA76099.1 hypothetical protein S40288_00389 [Stachybotrys chartarum IBT 40288]
MRYAFISAALVASVSAHGFVKSIEGANGVTMPGLTVADGTPRDCTSNGCGSQADTAIMRDREMGTAEASALGRTQGNGPVDAAAMISSFMGTGTAPTNAGAASAAGVEDDLSQLQKQKAKQQRREEHKRQIGNLFGGLMGAGGQQTDYPVETMVADTAGEGASSGLPTATDAGEVNMVFRQINQDGAGPLTAEIDGTSGGTDNAAFQKADVTKDVPGLGIQGLSLATNTEFPLTVKMAPGQTCDASVGGADNVCVVRVRNGAGAGPFGGSAAFTQTTAGRKRAIAYRLKKRMQISRRD